MNIMSFLVSRLVQPSSWLGIAAFAYGVASAPHIHDFQSAVFSIGAGLGGVGAFVANEHWDSSGK
jgi:hypothetical protein